MADLDAMDKISGEKLGRGCPRLYARVMEPIPTPTYLTITQACRAMGCSRSRLFELRHRAGDPLPTHRLANDRVVVSVAEMREWAERNGFTLLRYEST